MDPGLNTKDFSSGLVRSQQKLILAKLI